MIRAGWSRPPSDASWLALYGTSVLTGIGFTMSVLTGIGFTMSLFIGTLAFGQSDFEAVMRLGVLVGSLLSALLGAAALTLGSKRAPIDAAWPS